MFGELMDVGIVTAPLDFGPSGPGVYLENLCLALQDLNTDDLDLHLIHYQKSSREIYEDANDVILPRTPGRFERRVSNLDLDVLHYNYIPYKRPLVFAIDVPLVVSVHGDFAFAMPEYAQWSRRLVAVPLQKLYARIGLLDRVDEFVPVSNALGGSLTRFLDIPQSKISTVYPGIDESFRKIPDSEAVLEDSYGIQPPYILNVNNYMEKKNRATLLEAFTEIRRERPDISLVLAGGGWEESSLQSRIQNLGLTEHVSDLGFVPKEDLASLYSGAEALVNPTLRETFGFTNLEAMACGCPVVTSNSFAIPEVVGDGALLVDAPEDPDEIAAKTLKLLRTEDLQRRLQAAGERQVENFSWEQTAKKMTRIYERNAR